MRVLATAPLVELTAADPLAGDSSVLVSELWFLLFLQIVYSYYLEWNILALLLRLTQMLWLSRSAASPNQRKAAASFLYMSNTFVVIMHLFGKGHPFSINFIGRMERSSLLYVLMVDILIALLEVLMLHLLAITPSNRRPTTPWNEAVR